MNKKEAIKRLDALENEANELRKIIDGSGFDWDFLKHDITLTICDGNDNISFGVDEFKKTIALNIILFHLAEHFNPEGWEPDWNCKRSYKYYIRFSHSDRKVVCDHWNQIQTPIIHFHKDAINDVIAELENNRDKWVHLVGWEFVLRTNGQN